MCVYIYVCVFPHVCSPPFPPSTSFQEDVAFHCPVEVENWVETLGEAGNTKLIVVSRVNELIVAAVGDKLWVAHLSTLGYVDESVRSQGLPEPSLVVVDTPFWSEDMPPVGVITYLSFSFDGRFLAVSFSSGAMGLVPTGSLVGMPPNVSLREIFISEDPIPGSMCEFCSTYLLEDKQAVNVLASLVFNEEIVLADITWAPGSDVEVIGFSKFVNDGGLAPTSLASFPRMEFNIQTELLAIGLNDGSVLVTSYVRPLEEDLTLQALPAFRFPRPEDVPGSYVKSVQFVGTSSVLFALEHDDPESTHPVIAMFGSSEEHVTAVGDEDLCFPTLENTARSFVCCHLGDFDTRPYSILASHSSAEISIVVLDQKENNVVVEELAEDSDLPHWNVPESLRSSIPDFESVVGLGLDDRGAVSSVLNQQTGEAFPSHAVLFGLTNNGIIKSFRVLNRSDTSSRIHEVLPPPRPWTLMENFPSLEALWLMDASDSESNPSLSTDNSVELSEGDEKSSQAGDSCSEEENSALPGGPITGAEAGDPAVDVKQHSSSSSKSSVSSIDECLEEAATALLGVTGTHHKQQEKDLPSEVAPQTPVQEANQSSTAPPAPTQSRFKWGAKGGLVNSPGSQLPAESGGTSTKPSGFGGFKKEAATGEESAAAKPSGFGGFRKEATTGEGSTAAKPPAFGGFKKEATTGEWSTAAKPQGFGGFRKGATTGEGSTAAKPPAFGGFKKEASTGEGSTAAKAPAFGGFKKEATTGEGSTAAKAPGFGGFRKEAATGEGSTAAKAPGFGGFRKEAATGEGSTAAKPPKPTPRIGKEGRSQSPCDVTENADPQKQGMRQCDPLSLLAPAAASNSPQTDSDSITRPSPAAPESGAAGTPALPSSGPMAAASKKGHVPALPIGGSKASTQIGGPKDSISRQQEISAPSRVPKSLGTTSAPLLGPAHSSTSSSAEPNPAIQLNQCLLDLSEIFGTACQHSTSILSTLSPETIQTAVSHPEEFFVDLEALKASQLLVQQAQEMKSNLSVLCATTSMLLRELKEIAHGCWNGRPPNLPLDVYQQEMLEDLQAKLRYVGDLKQTSLDILWAFSQCAFSEEPDLYHLIHEALMVEQAALLQRERVDILGSKIASLQLSTRSRKPGIFGVSPRSPAKSSYVRNPARKGSSKDMHTQQLLKRVTSLRKTVREGAQAPGPAVASGKRSSGVASTSAVLPAYPAGRSGIGTISLALVQTPATTTTATTTPSSGFPSSEKGVPTVLFEGSESGLSGGNTISSALSSMEKLKPKLTLSTRSGPEEGASSRGTPSEIPTRKGPPNLSLKGLNSAKGTGAPTPTLRIVTPSSAESSPQISSKATTATPVRPVVPSVKIVAPPSGRSPQAPKTDAPPSSVEPSISRLQQDSAEDGGGSPVLTAKKNASALRGARLVATPGGTKPKPFPNTSSTSFQRGGAGGGPTTDKASPLDSDDREAGSQSSSAGSAAPPTSFSLRGGGTSGLGGLSLGGAADNSQAPRAQSSAAFSGLSQKPGASPAGGLAGNFAGKSLSSLTGGGPRTTLEASANRSFAPAGGGWGAGRQQQQQPSQPQQQSGGWSSAAASNAPKFGQSGFPTQNHAVRPAAPGSSSLQGKSFGGFAKFAGGGGGSSSSSGGGGGGGNGGGNGGGFAGQGFSSGGSNAGRGSATRKWGSQSSYAGGGGSFTERRR